MEQKIIDRIIPEPPGGAHRNPQQTAAILKDALIEEITALKKLKTEKLIEKRIEKFSKMGAWNE